MSKDSMSGRQRPAGRHHHVLLGGALSAAPGDVPEPNTIADGQPRHAGSSSWITPARPRWALLVLQPVPVPAAARDFRVGGITPETTTRTLTWPGPGAGSGLSWRVITTMACLFVHNGLHCYSASSDPIGERMRARETRGLLSP